MKNKHQGDPKYLECYTNSTDTGDLDTIRCPNCGNEKLVTAKYKNGAKWLECENCYTAVKPLNKIAKET